MTSTNQPAETLCKLYRKQARDVSRLRFEPPVSYVYNPLAYAWPVFARYLRRYANSPKTTLFLGMNPGPFGMVQTGIPFGDVIMVRDFLQLEGRIEKPDHVHPKRPVAGFACPRREVSGQRLWGWIAERYEKPERFFRDRLILNYCPLVFLEESGRNRTPDRLPIAERTALEDICDETLRQVVKVCHTEHIIGIGKWAAMRAEKALSSSSSSPKVESILHPSPASPLANRGWQSYVESQMQEKSLTKLLR